MWSGELGLCRCRLLDRTGPFDSNLGGKQRSSGLGHPGQSLGTSEENQDGLRERDVLDSIDPGYSGAAIMHHQRLRDTRA